MVTITSLSNRLKNIFLLVYFLLYISNAQKFMIEDFDNTEFGKNVLNFLNLKLNTLDFENKHIEESVTAIERIITATDSEMKREKNWNEIYMKDCRLDLNDYKASISSINSLISQLNSLQDREEKSVEALKMQIDVMDKRNTEIISQTQLNEFLRAQWLKYYKRLHNSIKKAVTQCKKMVRKISTFAFSDENESFSKKSTVDYKNKIKLEAFLEVSDGLRTIEDLEHGYSPILKSFSVLFQVNKGTTKNISKHQYKRIISLVLKVKNWSKKRLWELKNKEERNKKLFESRSFKYAILLKNTRNSLTLFGKSLKTSMNNSQMLKEKIKHKKEELMKLKAIYNFRVKECKEAATKYTQLIKENKKNMFILTMLKNFVKSNLEKVKEYLKKREL